jgi:hypothetical protein
VSLSRTNKPAFNFASIFSGFLGEGGHPEMISRKRHHHHRGVIGALVCALFVAGSAPGVDFPFLFDIGGITNASTTLSAVKPVQFNQIFECPHPCGLMPTYSKDGTEVNGGVPQRVNFSLHASILNATFNKFVSLDDDRLIDFDFESWNAVWSRNSNTSVYQNESRIIVQQAHPTWNQEQIEAQAKLEWESSAKELLVNTIAFIKSIRPSLRVGMYDFPSRYYYKGYNSSFGDDLRAENDNLFPLWCSMDALFPSVYQFYNSCNKPSVSKANREYVRSNVEEAVRIASEIPARCGSNAKAPPVLVYTWHR